MFSRNHLADTIRIAMKRAREMESDLGMTGHGVVTLWTPQDGVKLQIPFTNLITTAGDGYYANRAIAGIGPLNQAQPTYLVNGMKVGTGGATSAAKSGAGATIVTYSAGNNYSRNAFDTGYAKFEAVSGTDTGYYAIYQCTWSASTPNATISEATISTDAATDSAGAESRTIARVTFTGVPKGASDTLTITWNHKFLGAAT